MALPSYRRQNCWIRKSLLCQELDSAYSCYRGHNRQFAIGLTGQALHIVCRELLVGGAKVDARDNELKTPLHYAVLGGHESIMQALCNHGAAVNAADNCGQTPLHKAAAQGQLTLAQELIARGADENARLQVGMLPTLHSHQRVVDLQHKAKQCNTAQHNMMQ